MSRLFRVMYRRVPMCNNLAEIYESQGGQGLQLTGRGTARPELNFLPGDTSRRATCIEEVYAVVDDQKVIHYRDGRLSLKNYISKELADLIPDAKPEVFAD